MEDDVQFFYAKGLAPSTLRSYKSGKDHYTNFCKQASITPLPESKLCLFVSHVAKQGLKHQMIKCYLSAIRHLQISSGLNDPFAGDPWPRLDYVMRGIKKHQAELLSGQRSPLPITPDILSNIRRFGIPPPMNTTQLGFLHIEEITVPSDSRFDPGTHISLADVAFNHATESTQIEISIKQSNTDPFRKGVTLTLGRTRSQLCPVAAMACYLVKRGQKPVPLFQFQNGTFLTCQSFVHHIHSALQKTGVNPTKYNGHSFRIGAATTAAAKGMEDSMIKTLERWESYSIPTIYSHSQGTTC